MNQGHRRELLAVSVELERFLGDDLRFSFQCDSTFQ